MVGCKLMYDQIHDTCMQSSPIIWVRTKCMSYIYGDDVWHCKSHRRYRKLYAFKQENPQANILLPRKLWISCPPCQKSLSNFGGCLNESRIWRRIKPRLPNIFAQQELQFLKWPMRTWTDYIEPGGSTHCLLFLGHTKEVSQESDIIKVGSQLCEDRIDGLGNSFETLAGLESRVEWYRLRTEGMNKASASEGNTASASALFLPPQKSHSLLVPRNELCPPYQRNNASTQVAGITNNQARNESSSRTILSNTNYRQMVRKWPMHLQCQE
jgi:hypothetical protein